MPTYDYECQECGHSLEAFHAMSAKPLEGCPECGKLALLKLIGPGVAAIIKGTSTPCNGGSEQKKPRKPNVGPKLGRGKNSSEDPPWRTKNFEKLKQGKVKDLDGYINTGEVD